jgi:energy-coupling factor transport system permease protein
MTLMIKRLEKYNPIVVFLYFLLTAIAVTFSTESVIAVIFLFCSIIFYLICSGERDKKTHLYIFLLFLFSAAANPLFNHMGVTVLFVVNDNPVTLESFYYGLMMASVLTGIVYFFRCFSVMMTSDRLIYIFGTVSPKFALLISSALRFIPLFLRQNKKVREAQRGMGLYRDGNLLDRFRGEIRVFSVMVTWALENGIVTADSMSARGYSEKKRTNFSFYSFTKYDFLLLIIIAVLFFVIAYGKAAGVVSTEFYPQIVQSGLNLKSVIVYLCTALLVLLPGILKTGEEIRWKYLASKI